MIFTDPPYRREFLPAYGWLAHEARRVLKEHGFVVTMCGGAHINQVFRMFDNAGLTFYWEYDYDMVTSGQISVVWRRSNGQNMPVSTRTKRLLAYSKGTGISRMPTMGRFAAGSGDKKWHVWGQDVASARYFVDCFTAPGDLVLDPFIGGGTTMAACKLIGRRCIGVDSDLVALLTTRERINGVEAPERWPLFALQKAVP
jgi:hypothetical protein